MIAELALYLATPVSSTTRRRGYLHEAVSLWSRAGRCRASWEPHYERCRDAIRQAIATLPTRRVAVVLGSGLLRDVPIEDLCAKFEKVVLVDAVHLLPVRLNVLRKGLKNVSFVTADLSGYDELLDRERIRLMTGQDDIGGRVDALAFVRRMRDVDFVVSANLLSQIGVGVVRRLQRPDGHVKMMPEDTPTRLVAAHVESLCAIGAPTMLITDVSFEVRARDGRVLRSHDLMHGAELPEHDAAWEWTVAPIGEEFADAERVHKVKLIRNVAMDLH